MLELDNIKVLEYFNLSDKTDYDFAFKYAHTFNEPKDTLKVGDFAELQFGVIKELQQELGDGITWAKVIDLIIKVANITEEEVGRMTILDFFQFKSYMVEQVNAINELEGQMLGHSPDGDEQEAGIDQLQQFGYYPQELKLAGGDPLRVEQARQMKYSEALIFLAYDKAVYDFQERLHKVKTRKIKK